MARKIKNLNHLYNLSSGVKQNKSILIAPTTISRSTGSMLHKKITYDIQIERIKKIFNEPELTLSIANTSVVHNKCGNKLQLKIIYGVSVELKFDVIYATAECECCNLFSGYENDLVSAIETINSRK